MDTPIGFVTLREATDIIVQKMGGDVDVERVIAEGCESGQMIAAYRSVTGQADDLDRRVWQMPHWRNYFDAGMIVLDLPLLDEKFRPNKEGLTARCPREIFIRRDSVTSFVERLEPAAAAGEEATTARARSLTAKTVGEFVGGYLAATTNPTIDDLRDYAKGQNVVGGREIYEPEYRSQMKARGHTVGRRGRRPLIREK